MFSKDCFIENLTLPVICFGLSLNEFKWQGCSFAKMSAILAKGQPQILFKLCPKQITLRVRFSMKQSLLERELQILSRSLLRYRKMVTQMIVWVVIWATVLVASWARSKPTHPSYS